MNNVPALLFTKPEQKLALHTVKSTHFCWVRTCITLEETKQRMQLPILKRNPDEFALGWQLVSGKS